jgi:hypothetical protein
MKKLMLILGLVVIATLFSCEKKNDCWSCEQKLIKGAGYHTVEYCGSFQGMRDMEHRNGGLYTKYDCSLR